MRAGIDLKYTIVAHLKKNKVLLLILCAVALVGILTGVLVAVKSGLQVSTLSDFNLAICDCSGALKLASLWQRFSSCLIVLGLLLVASLSVYTLPIGFVVLAYRAYLIGFNCALMICLFGVGGALTSLLIVIPCQLLLLAVMIESFVLLINLQEAKKKYGQKGGLLKTILFGLLLAFVICLLESLLLGIFNANTILVL